uniref:Uncharacterized protein n=1 Tax=Ditylum brightwellii TaxID=49249 RepID=A0A7S4RYL1_9STRA
MGQEVNLASEANADLDVKCPTDKRSFGAQLMRTMILTRESSLRSLRKNGLIEEKKADFSASDPTETEDLPPDVPLIPRHGSTVSVSIARYPANIEEEDRVRINTEFASAIRGILTEAYGRPPNRADVNEYVILRSGQGCSSCVCVTKPPTGHPCTQFTALWIAARLVVWALASERCDVRAGLDGGMVQTIFDAYNLPDVKGEAIESAARIMDCALPGQVLANWETFVKPLESPANQRTLSSRLFYRMDPVRHDIVVGRGVRAIVQSVIGQVTSHSYALGGGGGHSSSFGNLEPPEAKWYLSLNPSELSKDAETGIKVKVPPRELLQRHKRVAFVGITHDKLAKVFRQVLEEDPDHTWDRILLFFLSDEKMEWAADSIVSHAPARRLSVLNPNGFDVIKEKNVEELTMQEAETILYGTSVKGAQDADTQQSEKIQTNKAALIKSKAGARAELEELLTGKVRELRFLSYDRPFYCASYWDWDEWGGFIHVSPMIWGADPKTCPAMNYHWIGVDPGDDYVSYQDGLSSLLRAARPV